MAQVCLLLLVAFLLIPAVFNDALGGLLHLGAVVFAVYFGVSIFGGGPRGPQTRKRR